MDAFSVSGLNPAAPPFRPVALVPAQYIGPHPAALPPVGFLPPQCLYPPPPPPPACWGLVACDCTCGAGFAAKGCTCAPFVWEGVPAFSHPAWVQPPPPRQVAPLTVYYCPPPPRPTTPAANCCRIEEIDGVSDEATNAKARDVPSPRSVLSRLPTSLLPRRRAGHPRTSAPPPPPRSAVKAKARHGRKPHLAFDPNGDVTSLMIRNIPNKFMKGRFMAILDQHCAEENDKLPSDGGAVKSEYDFLYVPVDFGTKCNRGYAFVNMTTATAARRLHAFLQGHRWEAAGSSKMCDVVHARIGGLDAFVEHFSGSQFPCDTKEFLPVRFEPPRDGVRQTEEHVVGRLARSC